MFLRFCLCSQMCIFMVWSTLCIFSQIYVFKLFKKGILGFYLLLFIFYFYWSDPIDPNREFVIHSTAATDSDRHYSARVSKTMADVASESSAAVWRCLRLVSISMVTWSWLTDQSWQPYYKDGSFGGNLLVFCLLCSLCLLSGVGCFFLLVPATALRFATQRLH